jgi:hypothetical protein
MQQDFASVLRSLHDYISRPEFAEELARAKKGYFEQIGSPREGEAFLEMRLMSFIEWFTFERKLDRINSTPVSMFIKEGGRNISETGHGILAGLQKSIHSMFRVEKNKGSKVHLRDLFSRKKYKNVEGLAPSLDKGDMFEARIVPFKNGFHLTDAYCYHPPDAHRFLVQEIKKARKTGDDLEGLLRQFMAMSTKWERYPRMKVTEIYKWTPGNP